MEIRRLLIRVKKGARTVAIVLGILLASAAIPYFASDVLRLTGFEQTVSYNDRLTRNFDFSANDTAVVFPIPLDGRRVGLLFFDRLTDKTSIIIDDEANLIKAEIYNAEKVLIVKNRRDKFYLLDCEVRSWRCFTLLETENYISSAVRLTGEALLLTASPPLEVSGRKRFGRFDFYLLETGSPLTPLTAIGIYGLDALSIFEGKLFFTAVGTGGDILEYPFPVAGLSTSQIYNLEFDPVSKKIKKPEKKLKPLFQYTGGLSTHSAVAADGSFVAFLHGKDGSYGVALATRSGELLKSIDATEGSFSRPAITATEVIMNELSANRYRVQAINRSTYRPKFLFDVRYNSGEMQKLDKIKLKIIPK